MACRWKMKERKHPMALSANFICRGSVSSQALIVAFVIILILSHGIVNPSQAKGRSLIRDAEVETIIRSFATPLLKAGGLQPDDVDIIIVGDDAVNAFVSGGANIFINTGLLLRTTNASQLIGVLAHEIGHIRGGHLVRTRAALATTSKIATIAMILGAATTLATGRGDAGMAIARGGQATAQNSFLAYSRGQESAADQAALDLLAATGQSARGLEEFLGLLDAESALSERFQDAYALTHPLSRERMATVRRALEGQADIQTPPEMIAAHARMQGKLKGFLRSSSWTYQNYPESDRSLPARYARTIAAHRDGDTTTALTRLDSLLNDFPRDAFFHELKGQIYLESGQIMKAERFYRQAVTLAQAANLPAAASAQLKSGLAQALLSQNQASKNQDAAALLAPLNPFLADDPMYWRQLAIARGRTGEEALAALALAESAMRRFQLEDAHRFAGRALTQLKTGSPGWLRAKDITAQVALQLKKR